MSKRSKWKTISLRTELVEKVEKLIEHRPDLGYTSVADFIADAVRRRLEELSKSPLER
ncbi:MAG: CopG family transcriptional regulator [Nitrososphaerota archaeon]